MMQFFYLLFFLLFPQGTHLHSAQVAPTSLITDADVGHEVFVDVDGAKLFCRSMGKGKPIIVVHGGPGLSQEYLRPQLDRLVEHNLVIFYDQRASGRSTGEITPESMQIKTFVSDLDAVRKAFGFEKVTLIGHSWGGFLIMNYAISHPESVDKLVLVDSATESFEDNMLFLKENARRLAPYEETLKMLQESKLFKEGDPETFAEFYRTIFRAFCYIPEKANELTLTMTPTAALNSLKINHAFGTTVFSKPFNLSAQLNKFTMPVLIIHGDHDPIPLCTAENTHKSIPHSKLVVIKNCGHFPYVETPDVFFKELEEFLL